MFLSPTSVDEHVHALLEEIHGILEDVRAHQLKISNAQCKSMEELLKVLRRMIDKQGKMLNEVLLGNRVRQLQYEGTLNALAEQQQKVLNLLEKWTTENCFININTN